MPWRGETTNEKSAIRKERIAREHLVPHKRICTAHAQPRSDVHQKQKHRTSLTTQIACANFASGPPGLPASPLALAGLSTSSHSSVLSVATPASLSPSFSFHPPDTPFPLPIRANKRSRSTMRRCVMEKMTAPAAAIPMIQPARAAPWRLGSRKL